MLKPKCALFSTFDKEGIVEFAKGLEERGIKIFATGGTAKTLIEKGIDVKLLSEITGFPEILGGKVKTLHPDIFARILATEEEAKELNIARFEILVVNLYSPEIEPDIGGVSLIRAGIKAGDRTVVITDKKDYNLVYLTLKNTGGIPDDLKEELNRKAARYVINYQIENYRKYFKWDFLPYIFEVYRNLNYGTNPTRKGYLVVSGSPPDFEVLKGDLSLNNLYDADSAVRCALALNRVSGLYSACIVKHGSPCGAACSTDPREAVRKAWESDTQSAYGGILAVSFPIIKYVAEELQGKFLEVIASPHFYDDAVELLVRKKARLIRFGYDFIEKEIVEIKGALGGFTFESYNDKDEDIRESDFKPTYEFEFTEEDIKELMFSYTVARFGRSNCVAITSGMQILGIGVGMTSRVSATKFAIEKFEELMKERPKPKKIYVSSDGFFPFPDSIELISTRIKNFSSDIEIFVAHPGGSIRDKEVIETAKKLGVKLFVTGKRCFRH